MGPLAMNTESLFQEHVVRGDAWGGEPTTASVGMAALCQKQKQLEHGSFQLFVHVWWLILLSHVWRHCRYADASRNTRSASLLLAFIKQYYR